MTTRIQNARRSATKLVRGAAALILVLTVMSAEARACWCGNPKPHHCSPQPPSCPTTKTPEIDPGSVLSALTLLGGGLMILGDRRSRTNGQVSVS